MIKKEIDLIQKHDKNLGVKDDVSILLQKRKGIAIAWWRFIHHSTLWVGSERDDLEAS